MSEALQKRGITVEASLKGNTLKPKKDGYLGEITGGKLQLRCSIQKQNPMPICFLVNGSKNVLPIKDRSSNQIVSFFIRKVPVEQIDNGVFTTKYPNNNLRLAVFGTTGKFEIWEVAIVSQDGFFFLTEQMPYSSQFFRGENNQILCPDFDEKWPQLIEMLKPVMEKQELLPISEYITSPTLKTEGLRQRQGKVIWWSLVLQMGLIVLDTKGTVARVHWKNLKPCMNRGLRKLTAGQVVSFQRLLPIPTGARKSNLLLEAREVIPI